jgi:hypothetical protein
MTPGSTSRRSALVLLEGARVTTTQQSTSSYFVLALQQGKGGCVGVVIDSCVIA